MTKEFLSDEYFDWMYDKVMGNKRNYRNVLNYLNSVEFKYTMEMDSSRAGEGVTLRYHFGLEKRYPDSMIAAMLDVRPCSVLEMMVALCIRMERTIMVDNFIGDRTTLWFMDMLISLGLDSQDDRNFDYDRARRIVNRFLVHGYSRNGKGGLFTVHSTSKDMRNEEIWSQLMWYLNEKIDKTEYTK